MLENIRGEGFQRVKVDMLSLVLFNEAVCWRIKNLDTTGVKTRLTWNFFYARIPNSHCGTDTAVLLSCLFFFFFFFLRSVAHLTMNHKSTTPKELLSDCSIMWPFIATALLRQYTNSSFSLKKAQNHHFIT